MKIQAVEATYPVTFRKEDSAKLGGLLRNRRSVVLVGMKRVGISYFLRFFLNNKNISKTYIKDRGHFFIPVDLNDLVEREIFPFWILTFKRMSDEVAKSEMPTKIKKQIETFFLDSIQSQDLFLTIDYIRKSLILLSSSGVKPTIFFLRFDRMKDTATNEFFDNLEGLIEATNRKLSYVFTSVRSFDFLFPSVFSKHNLSYFSDSVYIKPTNIADTKMIFDTYKNQEPFILPKKLEDEFLDFVDGHNQYLQFALISLHEIKNAKKLNRESLWDFLVADERISFQSEEIWESLTPSEQDIMIKIFRKEKLAEEESNNADYLLSCGFFDEKARKIFSPLFEYFVGLKEKERRNTTGTELSKKEFMLLSFLEQNEGSICEREQIVEAVWPEGASLGVSDWAIDRLVARLRGKLRNQNLPGSKQGKKYEIVTVKTRGYKLVK